jgi:trehalose-phosphatase
VHYRHVAPADRPRVAAAVEQVLTARPSLRCLFGKDVFELLPDVDWNKGAAVRRLMEAGPDRAARMLPVYAGDDLTDEDAFRAIGPAGVAIVVGRDARPSLARYALGDAAEVARFLEALDSAAREHPASAPPA